MDKLIWDGSQKDGEYGSIDGVFEEHNSPPPPVVLGFLE